MKTSIVVSLAMVAVIVLGGCGLVPEATTPRERVALCFATVSALANSTASQVEGDRISTAKGDEVLALLDNTQGACVVAQNAVTGNRPDDAIVYLDAAIAFLDQIERSMK